VKLPSYWREANAKVEARSGHA